MDNSLAGKTAIVTGAGRPDGIGYATALRLAELGADIVVTDVTVTSDLAQLVLEIEALGRRALAVAVDVTQADQITACVAQCVERFGGPDILVNNAGTTIGALPFQEIEPEHWDLSFQVNLKGPALFCRAVLPAMVRSGGGSIVNNASTGGLGAEAGFGAYTATKHGVIGLTKTIAAEYGEHGVRCNAVCPGYVATEMHDGTNQRLAGERSISIEAMKQERYTGVALRRAGTCAEIAEAIAYLASPASSYITGAAIPISGGTPVGL
jgi:NAD(P)-dependent dehydrogenase (short-subunit alcohol dehydrogenase family)